VPKGRSHSRGHGWRGCYRSRFVAQPECSGQQLLGDLVACRQTDLAHQTSLTPAAFSRLFKLHGSSECVRGLRQPTGRLLHLGHVVKG
jgi:hypothetical protein